MQTYWQCPVCQQPLDHIKKLYRCENEHSFDCAKEGYVNLLLANQKHSKDPGDSREMIRSRKAFLANEYYQPLADAITHKIPNVSQLLDAGCGEGYYTDYVVSNNPSVTAYGIDISKDAVRYAAKLNKSVKVAVASINQLPVQDQSMDVVLSIFSPRNPIEMQRVLKSTGFLMTASPARNHLLELRQRIYDEIRPYDLLADDVFAPNFRHVERQEVTYPIHLTDSDDIRNLLQMTPFYWHIPQAKQTDLLALQTLEVQIAFEVSIWQPITDE